MKIGYLLIIFLLLYSCTNSELNNKYLIVQEGQVDKEVLGHLDLPSSVLLKWYLYAYGNECIPQSKSVKCTILDNMNIINECSEANIDFLNNWLSNNKLIFYKLKKDCPLLPHKGAIQNKIVSIIINRKADTLSLSIKANGLNNSQEKTWSIDQSDSYVIIGKTLVKK